MLLTISLFKECKNDHDFVILSEISLDLRTPLKDNNSLTPWNLRLFENVKEISTADIFYLIT